MTNSPSQAMGSTGMSRENRLNCKGSYAQVNGLQMYYETCGTAGRPLVLLHGGMSAIGTSFGKVLPGFARERQVIAIEQQGHGHTGDADRPLTYEQMAKDTLALLTQIGIDQADFFGYSIGAGIALEISIRNPDRVRRLVIASPTFNRGGFQPGVLEGIDLLQPELLAGSPFEQEYKESAPNPNDWPTLIAKTKQLDREFTGWASTEVASIHAPTLLIYGDSDIVRPEHMVEMFRLLGGGISGDNVGLPKSQLAVLPGTTHVTLVDRADWLVSMVNGFLDTPIKER